MNFIYTTFSVLLKGFLVLCPWFLKNPALNYIFGYKIHPKARIGISWIYPEELQMRAGSRIGHFNVAIHLKLLVMEEESTISRRNWITGFPAKTDSKHFAHQKNRLPALIIGKHSAITKNHHIDCTNTINVGEYTTIAGYFSQLLTHSVDVFEGIQTSSPINIGKYCFIGTNVVLLGGSTVPDYSVVGAKALVTQAHKDPGYLYGGVPAKPLMPLPSGSKYFTRKAGWVD